MLQTNWCVITGAPCSGKTSVIDTLAERGYRIAPEVARSYMEELLRSHNNHELEDGILHLQQEILTRKLRRENELPEDELIFFDRGLPDSIAYYQIRGEYPAEVVAACCKRRYQQVFIFDRLPFREDEVRHDDPQLVEKLDKLIRDAYRLLEYDYIRVPVMSIEERVEYVLAHLE